MKNNKIRLVWLIDDDSVSNMIHSVFFHEHFPRIQIKTFEKAEEALHDLKQNIKSKELKFIPDLIILDINMPVMNGWDFLEDFHDSMIFMTEQIGVVMLTSSIATEDYRKSLQFPAVIAYLTKPLDLSKLEDIIQ
jgi:CheY-like chemotaxis protein